MRIVLVVHGFPPHECTGVETHVEALARALARRGLEIEVFSTRADPRAPDFALRSEQREGFRLTWVVQNRVPQSAREHAERPGAVAAFAEFLERVRPQLVHFHHVHKLGIGSLEQAALRNIPSVFTAHDYFPICHRVVLSRPDLRRCETLGDAAACARCDSAVGYLDSLGRWSDWQAGVFPGALAEQEQRELSRLLEQDGAALEERASLDSRRRAAFAALDLVLAPSEFLRARLIEGGLDAARIERCAYGIELEALRALEVRREDQRGPLRFGYLGGAHKHKGVHVLLEAFSRLRSKAELHIHADSSDREHVATLRARAAELGASWHGAFRADELPARMAGFDVLVVPSIWWENAPFVILEAQAAGRAVIASDLPALREGVYADAGGLLVAPDDPAALAAALERLASQPELAVQLAHNAAVPRSLDELCDELIARYQGLIAKRARGLPDDLPDSVRGFAARILALEQETVDQLAARALGGLDKLAASLGCERPASDPIAGESMAIERLRDARREIRWRVAQGGGRALGATQPQQTAEEDRRQLAELQEVHAEMAAVLQAIHTELEQALENGTLARAALASAELELKRRAAQVDELEKAQQAARIALEAEARAHARTQAALQAATQALEVVSDELAQAARALEAAAEERAQTQLDCQELERANAQLSQDLRAAEQRHAAGLAREAALASEVSALAAQQSALAAHSAWLEREAAAVARRTGSAPQTLQTVEDFRAAHAALDQLDAELRWRREEMAALRQDGGRVLRALVARSAIGRRLREWGTGA